MALHHPMNDLKDLQRPSQSRTGPADLRISGVALGKISMGNFPDGEISCKIDEDVRGRDVFLLQPTCPPVNENLMELLIMIDSFVRASAYRVTAVIPYYGYARQDRKDAGRVPITAKLVANLITRAGADRVLAMDLHAAQIQGFFDVPVDHLYAAPVLNDYFQSLDFRRRIWSIVSADEGGIKRALGHATRLGSSAGDCRQAPHQRRRHQAGKRDRRAGERQDRPDVRRHDQHRQLDLRRRGGASTKPGPAKSSSARRMACWSARPSNGLQAAPISVRGHHRHDPAAAAAVAAEDQGAFGCARCWGRRSSASIGMSRSAGCSRRKSRAQSKRLAVMVT